MADFSTLQTRVNRILIDVTASVTAEVPTLVNEAVRQLEDLHNFKVMEALSSITTTLATRDIGAVPSNFKEYRTEPFFIVSEDGVKVRMQIAGNRALILDEFGEDADGFPRFLVEDEPTDDDNTRQWEVWPLTDGFSDYTDGEYRIRIPYWKYVPDMSADADANWFTTAAERYIIYQAASDAFFLDWDEERGAVYAQRAAPERDRVIRTDKRLRLSSVPTFVPYMGVRGSHLGN